MSNDNRYKLTNQQNNIYLLDSIYKDSGINNIISWLEINEEIDCDLLIKTANIIVQKNDSYRLKFNLKSLEPYQQVELYKEFRVDILEVADIGELEFELKNVRLNLEEELPFKFFVFKYPNGKGGLSGVFHHLISDAWSMSLLIQQIVTIYYNLKNDIPVDSLKYPSYIEYIQSQQEFMKSDRKKINQNYWEEVFATPVDILSFKEKTYTDIFSKRKEYFLNDELLSNVRKYCQYHGITEYIFMLSVYCIYFGRIKNTQRYIIGNPILNRANAKEKSTCGLFMSTNPFVVDIDKNISFISFAKQIQNRQMEMYRHLKYDYKELIQYINEKNNNYGNVFDVIFSYQNAKVHKEENNLETKSRWVENNKQVESLMIHLKDTDDTGKILFAYDYLTSVFSEKDIDLMHKRIENIITQVVQNIFIKNIEVISQEEKEILVKQYNNTYCQYNKNATIVSCFENVCKNKPNDIALIFNDEKITYDKLNKKANQLARVLDKLGVKNGDIVCVVDSRSIEMIVSMLAILKLGAAYLPIDIEYPKDRIEYIMNNANCNVCVTRKIYKDVFNVRGKKVFSDDELIYSQLDENIYGYISSDNLAYMIYTSGSTGNPKGVMLTHKNVINFITGVTNIIDFKNKTIVSVTTISFDIFVLESWLALLQGCTIVIANENEQNIPYHLNKLCLKYNVNMIQTTPSRMQILMSDKDNIEFIKSMTDIMVGGEGVPYTLIENIRNISNAKIYNMYGPTETTVWSTIKELTNDTIVTIGRPICNTQIYIFDNDMNLCPINVEGNLYIGGDGLSKGYYNNIGLTNEKFIPNPFIKNEYIYNTGDIAKWNKEGQLECLGRSDFQIKLHGHRIELGEIENVILKFSDIKEASVICVNNSVLHAFYTSKVTVKISELKKHLQQKLPVYMLPTQYIQVESLPKTPNGKTDKKALLKLESNIKGTKNSQLENNEPQNMPTTEIEINICKMISLILNKECNNIDADIIQLGMDSLNIIDLCNRITKEYQIEISIKDIFNLRDISSMAKKVESMIKQTNEQISLNVQEKDTIKKAKNKDRYKATISQKRIYFASKSSNNELVYNMPYSLILNGMLDVEKLIESINEVIKRHISLQLSFNTYNGELYQQINRINEFKIDVEKINEEEINKKYKEFVKPFDFSIAPLMRIKLLKIHEQKYVLLFDMHHIISDGASLQILVDDISNIYNGQNVKPLQLQYIDYTENEFDKLQNNKFALQKQFWLEKFNKLPEPLNLQYDYTSSNINSFEGNKLHWTLGKEKYEKIEQLAKTNGVTPYMVFLSIYYIVLSRYTQNSDIVIGVPMANRDNVAFDNIIGLFVNDVPVRLNINNENNFIDVLNIVKKSMLDIVNNSDLPNGEIIKWLKENNINVGNKLFDTMFIFQNNRMPSLNLNGIQAVPYLIDTEISKYNISLEIINQKENMTYEINLEYATQLFKKSTIENMLNHFNNILEEVLIHNNIQLKNIQMINNEEKNKLLYEFNNTYHQFDVNETIHQMIEKQSKKTPNDIALVCGNEKVSYKLMNELTYNLACYLRQRGVGPNDVIGIMVPRSLEMLLGIIGVLKSGASYMPIDITYPKDRIEYMLKNSNAKYVLTITSSNIELDNAIDITLNKSDVYNVNRNIKINNINNGNDTAYIIYTSGSTGTPKGVMVKHKGITNLVHYCNDNVEFLKNVKSKNIASVTTMSFDIFVFETLIALQRGLTVVIANEDEQRIPSKLNELIKNNNIEIIQTTPSRMQMLIEYKKDIPSFSNLKYVVLAGEQYTDKLFNDIINLNPKVISYNGYGPSETTIFSTLTLVNKQPKINIGKPLYNTQLYVLDNEKRLMPIGQVGELYIGGQGVSKGYMNNVSLTQQRFIQNPYEQGQIIYQTGDLARWLENGELECLGRTDSQVKIRGLRIELEEIENAIIKSGLVDKVVVIDKIDMKNRQYLSAYFISNVTVDTSRIRKHLSNILPQYMIPTHIEQVTNYIYTPNGKIDKNYLRQKNDDNILENEKNIILPKTKLQDNLVKIYRKILNVDSISVNDNFFEVGGDSILAMRLQIELINQGFDITYADIFKYSTVEQLEQRILMNKKENIDTIKINDYGFILNNTLNNTKIQKNSVKSVLLTGVTGFVGIHVLSSLIESNVQKIYCIVRDKENKSAINRLKDKLHFYFSTKYDKYIGSRIITINGDIANADLGMDKSIYSNLVNDIDVVINSSAKVSHYGNEAEFNNINVISVQNLVGFCKKYNKKLFHISTMSVSGNALVDQTYISNNINGTIDFKENNFYVNQPLDNVYIKTKFMAENIILDNILKGLDAYILRLGNIMARYEDGVFQDNINDNAYLNRINAIYNLGVIPDYIKNGYLEFTPVDYCANAIVKIVFNNNNQNRIFHLFNNKHITLLDFIDICSKLYKKIEIVNDDIFNKRLKELIKTNDYIASYILNDMDENKKLQYESNIKVNADFTNQYLSKLGFDWPNINKEYIKKFFDYLFNKNFFRKE